MPARRAAGARFAIQAVLAGLGLLVAAGSAAADIADYINRPITAIRLQVEKVEAREQALTDLIFQAPNRLADRRLCAMQLGRGARKAAFRGNCEKHAQFRQFHGGLI